MGCQPGVLGDQQTRGDPYGFLGADLSNGAKPMMMMQNDSLLPTRVFMIKIRVFGLVGCQLLGHDPGDPLLMGDDRTDGWMSWTSL